MLTGGICGVEVGDRGGGLVGESDLREGSDCIETRGCDNVSEDSDNEERGGGTPEERSPRHTRK